MIGPAFQFDDALKTPHQPLEAELFAVDCKTCGSLSSHVLFHAHISLDRRWQAGSGPGMKP